MTEEIKARIELINRGEIPCGYNRTFFGVLPNEWDILPLSDILYNEVRPVGKPDIGYWRLGLRSHAKGTFHEFVTNPEDVSMDELYVVKTDDLIVNITFAWEHAIAIAGDFDDRKLVSHRFPTYVFQNGNVAAFYKYVVLQKWFKELLVNISPGGAGRNRVMSKKDFLKLLCPAPPLPEQQKIAEILTTYDKLIALKKELIAEKQKLKKSCLSKMFPKDGSNVPEVRFPGFSGDWEQREAKEICQIGTGKSNTQDQIEDGTYPFFIRSDTAVKSNKYLYDCEAVITIGDGNIGRVFHYINDKFDLHQRCYKMTDFKEVTGKYFYYFFGTKFYERAMSMTAKATVDSVRLEMISEMPISYPKLKQEQENISHFLTTLDNLINLHQRELEEMEKQKKALMQLLLTGIVRVN